jgi:1-acyl-sn-glycerol-3-phosphate acyltransferase
VADVQSVLAGNSLGAKAFYQMARWIVVTFCRTWLRLSVKGVENIPTSGAFILAPVHRSSIDIPISSAVTRRRMRFMGKDSLWKFKIVGSALSALGAFPVTRGSADLEALKRCIAFVNAGEPLVLFPEGTRQVGDSIAPLFDGAAYVALKTQVPIIPVGIGGSQEVMPSGSFKIRRLRCAAVVGRPIYPATTSGSRAPRGDVRDLTERLSAALQVLLTEALTISRQK